MITSIKDYKQIKQITENKFAHTDSAFNIIKIQHPFFDTNTETKCDVVFHNGTFLGLVYSTYSSTKGDYWSTWSFDLDVTADNLQPLMQFLDECMEGMHDTEGTSSTADTYEEAIGEMLPTTNESLDNKDKYFNVLWTVVGNTNPEFIAELLENLGIDVDTINDNVYNGTTRSITEMLINLFYTGPNPDNKIKELINDLSGELIYNITEALDSDTFDILTELIGELPESDQMSFVEIKKMLMAQWTPRSFGKMPTDEDIRQWVIQAGDMKSVYESLLIEEGFVDNIYIRDLDENDQDIMVDDMMQIINMNFLEEQDLVEDEDRYNKIKSLLYDLSFDLNTLTINDNEDINNILDIISQSETEYPEKNLFITYLNEIISKNKSMFLYDESVVNEDLDEDGSLAINKYSVDQSDRKQGIITLLEEGKAAIDSTVQEDFYNQLVQTNEKMIMNLLNEFNTKSSAIENKIISLSEVENFDFSSYSKKLKSANEVVDAVSLMTEALLDVHNNITNDTLIGEGVEFDYMLLSRLQQDCEYYLGNGSGSERNLHQGSVEAQISKMKELWNGLEEKPEWLSMEQIEKYENDMLQIKAQNEGVGSWLKVWNTVKSFFANFKTASKNIDIALNNI